MSPEQRLRLCGSHRHADVGAHGDELLDADVAAAVVDGPVRGARGNAGS